MQLSTFRESCGEIKLNAAIADLIIISIPGFSAERFKYHYQQASKVNWIATLQAGPPQYSTQPITQQSTSPAKKKRNLRTRNQKKKKAQAQILRVTLQEMDHNQEVEHSLGAWNKPSKHVVLKQLVRWDRMCTSLHTVIRLDQMTIVTGMTIDYGVNQMRRLDVE